MSPSKHVHKLFLQQASLLKAMGLSEEAKEKIRAMNQSDVPISQRRALYNQMGRRVKNEAGLKPGLVEKYNACLSNGKERFKLLKEFIIDADMSGSQDVFIEFQYDAVVSTSTLHSLHVQLTS